VENKREKNIEAKRSKITRLKILFSITGLLLFALICRIYYIQIYKGEELSQRAVSQWFKITEKNDVRGEIYDRNMIPLTNTVKRDYIIVKKPYEDELLYLLSQVSGLERNTLISYFNKSDNIEVMIRNYNEEIIEELISKRGVSLIEREIRYYNSSIANHTIGYINKSRNEGEAGLEKYFNEELTKNREYKIGSIVDAKNEIIPGMGYIVFKNGKEKMNIVTTLDFKIQRIIEKQLDKNKYNGSIVVLDGSNGNILGMVSRPNFDQNNISAYLNSKEKELFNKAIQMTYPPGSIFKIIVAAVALENRIVDSQHRFYCNGFEDLYGNIIKCYSYDNGGHGELTFREGFVKSCNSVFIQVGRMVGGEELLKMAGRLGLGEKTGLMIEEEVAGLLPSKDYVKGAGIGNISIGQGTLEVTPIQIARVTNIILNDGIDKGIRLVDKIINDEGDIITQLPYNDKIRLLSLDTSHEIKNMMRDVIVYGTGKNAWLEDTEIAGKTGSAEAVDDNKKIVHAWFSGFYKGQVSDYVITIIIEDGVSGGETAAPIFRDIVTEMKRLGY